MSKSIIQSLFRSKHIHFIPFWGTPWSELLLVVHCVNGSTLLSTWRDSGMPADGEWGRVSSWLKTGLYQGKTLTGVYNASAYWLPVRYPALIFEKWFNLFYHYGILIPNRTKKTHNKSSNLWIFRPYRTYEWSSEFEPFRVDLLPYINLMWVFFSLRWTSPW